MRFSDDKINYLSHLLFNALDEREDIDFNVEGNQVRLSMKEALIESFSHFDELEEKVRENLSSRARKMVEGSREWDEEYRKIYEEEIGKLKAV
jgi:hypothetical protein